MAKPASYLCSLKLNALYVCLWYGWLVYSQQQWQRILKYKHAPSDISGVKVNADSNCFYPSLLPGKEVFFRFTLPECSLSDLTTLLLSFPHSFLPKVQEPITNTIIWNLIFLWLQNTNRLDPKSSHWTYIGQTAINLFLTAVVLTSCQICHESFNHFLTDGKNSFCWKLFWYYTLFIAIPLNCDGKP